VTRDNRDDLPEGGVDLTGPGEHGIGMFDVDFASQSPEATGSPVTDNLAMAHIG
jgi:hypothetical protein